MNDADTAPATYDAIVIGGGASGLGGAVTLARSRRSVLVVDGGEPRNAPAAGVHGLLGREDVSPAALLEAGRSEARGYGATITEGQVTRAAPVGDGTFTVTTADERTVRARRLLIATGLRDELPEIAGVRELWGRDVLHCPYCHGWEVRDRAIGILATGPGGLHQAIMFRQLSHDVTFFSHSAPELTDEEAEQLRALGVVVVDDEVMALESDGGRLAGVRLRGGELVPLDAVTVAPRFVARVEGLSELGLRVVDHVYGVGERIEADETGRSTVPGVWVAGNATDLMAQVGGAADAGVRAAAQINLDLIIEDTARAVAAHRAAA